jgi:hypothetical protein
MRKKKTGVFYSFRPCKVVRPRLYQIIYCRPTSDVLANSCFQFQTNRKPRKPISMPSSPPPPIQTLSLKKNKNTSSSLIEKKGGKSHPPIPISGNGDAADGGVR